MRVVIGELLPLSLVVMISPLNIIPAILLLFSPRPLVKAPLFLAGFILGVGLVLGALVLVASAINVTPSSGSSRWTAIVRGALGLYLIIAGIRKLDHRPAAEEASGLPTWMDGLMTASPSRALGMGLILGALNPKNVAMAAAAALTLLAASMTGAAEVVVIASYALMASAGVAAPIVVMVVLGDKAPEVLRSWRSWLERNNATVMAVLFFVFGVVLLSQAIAAA